MVGVGGVDGGRDDIGGQLALVYRRGGVCGVWSVEGGGDFGRSFLKGEGVAGRISFEGDGVFTVVCLMGRRLFM